MALKRDRDVHFRLSCVTFACKVRLIAITYLSKRSPVCYVYDLRTRAASVGAVMATNHH